MRTEGRGTLGNITFPSRSLALRGSLALADWSALAYPAALLLALSLPFAAIQPLVVMGGLPLTSDKLAFVLVLAAWSLQGRRALPTLQEARLLLPTAMLVLVALISAQVADPAYAGEGLRYASRLLAAGFVMLLALRLRAQARGLLWAVAVGGGLSALLGLGEALRLPAAAPILALFKVASTRVGGELRVGASFEYATIASMYFEMVVPLAIVLAATARRRSTKVLALTIAAVCTLNVVLSLTRAGMLTLAAVFASLLVLGIARRGYRAVLLPTGLGALILLGGVATLLLRDPVFDLRLVTESDADWYGAMYSAPPTLALQAGHQATVDVDVRNEGRITWTADGNHPFALGYRWLTGDGQGVLDVAPVEVPLPHDVQPGDTIHLQALVNVPNLPAGTYRLDWGMLQRDVLQFYERGWVDAESEIQVQASPGTGALPEVVPRDDGEAPWVVGRLDLWNVAWRLFATHPLLGVGPDNFRHYYGAELGLEGWDQRVQANNLYLELLADLGVLGLAAFAWVVAGPIRAMLRPSSLLTVGVGLAIAAFLLHGLLDTFLAFTPTAFLFWLLSGVAQKPQVSGRW